MTSQNGRVILSLVHDTDRHSKQPIQCWKYMVQGLQSKTCLIPFLAEISWHSNATCRHTRVTLPPHSLHIVHCTMHMTSRGEASCKNHLQSLFSTQRMGLRAAWREYPHQFQRFAKKNTLLKPLKCIWLHTADGGTACLISY